MQAQGISAEMARADVVVTNPTHFAVALRYDPVSMTAPKVVAKGQRAVAREIIRLGRMHGVRGHREPAGRAQPLPLLRTRRCGAGEALRRGG
jgi:flagellar biosynthesis protein FlhB